MNDLVSIVMPSYNTAKFIEASIKSVLEQTYTNWELLIVDDCSTDNSDSVVKPYLKDKRIKYFKNVKNSGAAISRNKALREAKGRWIAFLDSDDIWISEKLEKQIKFMKENHYSFTCTDYKIQLNGEWLPYIYTSPNHVTKRKLYNYCYFSTITVMYDRNVVGLVQIKDIRKNNDYALWLKVIEKADCYRMPECMSFYIKHEGSISSGKKWKLIKYHYILWRDVCEKNKVVATLLTINNLVCGVVKKLRYKVAIKEGER